MQKVNKLFGKTVIDLTTGNKVAEIRDVVLSSDSRKLAGLVVWRGREFKGERVVRWSDLRAVGDVVIVEGGSFTEPAADPAFADLRAAAFQISGLGVLTASGERLGTVGDLFFEPGGAISGLEVKRGMLGNERLFLPAADVQAIGRDAVIATRSDLQSVADQKIDEPAAESSSAEETPMAEIREVDLSERH